MRWPDPTTGSKRFRHPGIVIALGTVSGVDARGLAIRIITGFGAIWLIPSSNHTLNEVLDIRSDLHHPVKKNRAIPSRRASPPPTCNWILLFGAGTGHNDSICPVPAGALDHGDRVDPPRYVDVIAAAISNPLRMLAGWSRL